MLWTDLERYNYLDPWRMMNRFNRAATRMLAPSPGEFPPVNVWMGEDLAAITAELPGVDQKDIDISVAGKTITLRGSRNTAADDACKGECRNRHERWKGGFTRSIEVPFPVDQEKVQATFARGVLQLTLPRAEADKPRKITIKAE